MLKLISSKITKFEASVIISGLVFFIAEFFGDSWFNLMANSNCFKYLGCNIGFFGYDAIVHFFSGVFEVLLIVWLCTRFAKFSILHAGNAWKNAFILISAVALLSVGWEIFEFSADQFRMKILGYNLTNPNVLAQPSNSDTMGDFTFALSGFLAGAMITRFVYPRSLEEKS